MKILFLLGKYPDDGGVARVTTVLSKGLKDLGHDVFIGSFLQDDGDNGLARDAYISRLKLSMPIGSKENVSIFNRFISNNTIDIIICQWAVDFRVSRLCRRAVKGTGCKIISVLHTSPGKTGAIQRVLDRIDSGTSTKGRGINKCKLLILKSAAKWSLKLTYYYSDYFLTLSPKLTEEAQSFMGFNKARKMGHIFNPITIDAKGEGEKKENAVLYVGRLDNITKKVERVLEVWKQLGDNVKDWSLTLVGDGPDRADLEAYAKNNSLQNVCFAGYTDPIQYYKRAKIVLLTSGYEGFPLVLGEAMSYGVIPVVLSSFIAVSDILEHGKSGLIVDMPFEAHVFAETLHSLMINEQLMDRMSHEAIIKSHSFELTTVLSEWERLFTAVCSSRREQITLED